MGDEIGKELRSYKVKPNVELEVRPAKAGAGVAYRDGENHPDELDGWTCMAHGAAGTRIKER